MNAQTHTVTGSQAQRSTSQALTPTMTTADKAKLALMLTQLASHFWRPDFTPAQTAALIGDYANDLGGCTITEVEIAIRDYRLQPKIPGKMKPFPGTDDLLALVQAQRKHLKELERLGKPVRVESRPMLWWHKPKKIWNPHWRESDVPAGELIKDEVGQPLREPRR